MSDSTAGLSSREFERLDRPQPYDIARVLRRRCDDGIVVCVDKHQSRANSVADHPNKAIRAAIEYALDRGWTLLKAGPRALEGKWV